MNATELYLKDGRTAGIFFCGQCRIVASSRTFAEDCCQNYKCESCGKDTGGRSYTKCATCINAERKAKEAERFAKAEKLTKWDGWVFCEGLGVGNGFFESIEDMISDIGEDGDESLPEYVWACEANHFVCADVSDITERIADNAYEDFDVDDLGGLDELSAAIDKFNEVNKDVVSYEPDYTKAVLLSPRCGTNQTG
jgi:hypothetical protein